MTQPPVSHGYPDWNRVVANVDTKILDTGTVVTNVATVYDLGFVGNFPAIGFFLVSTTVGNQFLFEFFDTAGFSSKFTSYRWDLIAGGTADRVVPVLGPYCRLTVTPSGAGGSHSVDVWSGQRGAIPQDANSSRNVLITVTATNVAAAATSSSTATKAWPGMAHWIVTSAAASWRCLLRFRDYQSNLGTIGSAEGGANQTVSMLVFLPSAQVRTEFTNTSGAAANFDTYVVGRPIELGA